MFGIFKQGECAVSLERYTVLVSIFHNLVGARFESQPGYRLS
jgi:hypothetical protein